MAGGLSEPALLELLPPPGRLTLDLACGTGELARELRDLGHEVLAVERSRELVREARHADKRMEVLRADVARMPMGSGIADLAVCGAFDGLEDALRRDRAGARCRAGGCAPRSTQPGRRSEELSRGARGRRASCSRRCASRRERLVVRARREP